MILYILVSTCCFFSLLNLVFVILLSNSVFRLLSDRRADIDPREFEVRDSGLVDPKPTPTYDPRFRRER